MRYTVWKNKKAVSQSPILPMLKKCTTRLFQCWSGLNVQVFWSLFVIHVNMAVPEFSLVCCHGPLSLSQQGCQRDSCSQLCSWASQDEAWKESAHANITDEISNMHKSSIEYNKKTYCKENTKILQMFQTIPLLFKTTIQNQKGGKMSRQAFKNSPTQCRSQHLSAFTYNNSGRMP